MIRPMAGALLAAAVVGCAQPGSPPGGEVDRSPPRVVQVTPAPFDTLTDLGTRVVIRFDERISERLDGVSEFRDAVLVSPAAGEVVAVRKRRSLEIIPVGGWEPDRVYRVVVLPVFRDLFGNQRREPIELVFSTGAPIYETALAGFVRDRLTGEVMPGARVEATRRIDASRYVAVTDTGGFFALRFLPAGAYDVRAWLDRDRDRAPDFFEIQDTAQTAAGVNDTLVLELALLPMDTTPARLARAEVIDSSKVRLVFDDYFATDSVTGTARLYWQRDSVLVTASGRMVHGSHLDSILTAEAAAREARQAARDSARADSARVAAAADTAGVPADTAGAAADTAAPQPDSGVVSRRRAGGEPRSRAPEGEAQPERPRAGRPPGAEGAPGGQRPPDRAGGQPQSGRQGRAQGAGQQRPRPRLPSRELILLLPGILAPDTAYYVEVEDVTNIRGVPGGGGRAGFRTPPPPDTAVADTAMADTMDAAAADTAAADTAAVDSAAVDTAGPGAEPPDTADGGGR